MACTNSVVNDMSAPRFSIASMLLLMMVVAVVLAAVVQAMHGEPGPPQDSVVAIIGCSAWLLGAIAGIIVALAYFRWPLAIVIGLPTGLVIGWVVAVLTVIPKGLPVLLAGCPLIVLYGVVVRFLSRPEDHNTVRSDRSVPPPMALFAPPKTLPDRSPSRSDRPWGARWDRPAAGVPRRFGMGILMLLVTLSAVLFSVLRTVGACAEVFAVISTMVAAVAAGQTFLFGGRYPRAASIWVGGCFFPLQFVVLCLWMYLEMGGRYFPRLDELLVLLIFSIPLGAGFGYLSGGVVGGVFLILDALAERQRSHRAALEADEPPGPTDVVQGKGCERHEEN